MSYQSDGGLVLRGEESGWSMISTKHRRYIRAEVFGLEAVL